MASGSPNKRSVSSNTNSTVSSSFDGFVPDIKLARLATPEELHTKFMTFVPNRLYGVRDSLADEKRGSFEEFQVRRRSTGKRDSDLHMSYIHEMLFDERLHLPKSEQNENESNPGSEEDEEGVSKKTLKNRARRKRQHARKLAMKEEAKNQTGSSTKFMAPPGLDYPTESCPCSPTTANNNGLHTYTRRYSLPYDISQTWNHHGQYALF